MELLATNNQSTLDTITQSGELDEKTETKLKKILESFAKSFSK